MAIEPPVTNGSGMVLKGHGDRKKLADQSDEFLEDKTESNIQELEEFAEAVNKVALEC